MKTIVSSLMLLLLVNFSSRAQDFPPPGGPAGERGQRAKALYVAYITEQLKLTEEDAQKFWPVHAQYDGEIKGLKRDMPELEREQAVLDIKKKYNDRFNKVLGNTRTDEFYRKDAEFRKNMIERLRQMRERERDGQRRMPPPGKRRPADLRDE